jgi:aminoglycoside phosphotransferase (APT) family kinase protein
MNKIDLPEELISWVEKITNKKIVRASRPEAGASREAWAIDVDSDCNSDKLFLLRDKGSGDGSSKDARTLIALRNSSIPVPQVIGYDSKLGAILLERIEGHSNFVELADDMAKEDIARHLMTIAGDLHRLSPSDLDLPHLTVPASTDESVDLTITSLKQALPALGDDLDPFFAFAINWLERKKPTSRNHISLVHSDLGPGNFLFKGNKITGLVDWEVAHFGDAMEDLATIAIRDMATPIGDLKVRFQEYQDHSGIEVDIDVVAYYRVLILTRNSLFISLGLKYPPAEFDSLEMLRFQALLMRAAAICVADIAGHARPTHREYQRSEAPRTITQMANAATSCLNNRVINKLTTEFSTNSANQIELAIENILYEVGITHSVDLDEMSAISLLLDNNFGDTETARAALTAFIASDEVKLGKHDDKLIRYLVSHTMRLTERRQVLMGDLFGRYPQVLN